MDEVKKKSQDAGAGQVVSSFKEAENAHCVVQPVCQWVVGWDSRWVVAVRKKKKEHDSRGSLGRGPKTTE